MPSFSRRRHSVFCRSTVLLTLLLSLPATAADIQPFTATYRATIKGFASELTSNLNQNEKGQWQFINHASIFFIDFTERSLFRIIDGQVWPVSYQFDDETLDFNWQQGTVKATSGDRERQLKLDHPGYDMLGYQLQLRLDLLQNPQLQQRDYRLVDGTKLKTYQLTRLDEVAVTVPMAKIKSVLFRLQRPGKNQHTLLWLAPAMNYLPVKLERIDNQKTVYKIELLSITIQSAGSRTESILK